MPTCRHLTHRLMRDWGATTVFGNPGSTELGFLAEWPDDFRYVLGLHESTVVAMADGYAQTTRGPVVVNLHSAGGLGHGLGSMVTAYHNRSPLVVLAGQQDRSLLPADPFLGAIDATEFPRPYVKWSCQPARAADVPAAFARALQVATQPPMGPVFLSVPADDWNQPAHPVASRPRTFGFGPDPGGIRAVADALIAGKRPAFVVGAAVDADQAVPDLVALAEQLHAEVWAAPMASRCSFPENHPLFAGFLVASQNSVEKALASHDVVVVIGAPAFTYHVPSPTPYDGTHRWPTLYVISDDPHVLARVPVGTGVLSTARLAIRHLHDHIDPTQAPGAPWGYSSPPTFTPGEPGELMSTAYVLSTLRSLLPPDVMVVEEAPSTRDDVHEYLPITAYGDGFLTMASGVLGFGLPAAVGVALAAPTRPVVAILGDGASMYGIQGLWTAARQRTPVTFVILDNGEYGSVRLHAERVGIQTAASQLGGLDFCALAAGMGCAAVRVHGPHDLAAALSEALAADVPTVVQVPVAPRRKPREY